MYIQNVATCAPTEYEVWNWLKIITTYQQIFNINTNYSGVKFVHMNKPNDKNEFLEPKKLLQNKTYYIINEYIYDDENFLHNFIK